MLRFYSEAYEQPVTPLFFLSHGEDRWEAGISGIKIKQLPPGLPAALLQGISWMWSLLGSSAPPRSKSPKAVSRAPLGAACDSRLAARLHRDAHPPSGPVCHGFWKGFCFSAFSATSFLSVKCDQVSWRGFKVIYPEADFSVTLLVSVRDFPVIIRSLVPAVL